MLFFESLTWKNAYFFFEYVTILILEIGYIYLIFKYLRNEIEYKIHKLDIFTLFSTLIIFTTFSIQSFFQKEFLILNIINIFTAFVLNTILCSILLITLSNIFTENINLTNYSIGLITLVVVISILVIILNDVHSLNSDKIGRNIKIFIYIIEIFFGCVTVFFSIYKGFQKNVEDNLILIINEEDIYSRHLSVSMIRRVKELYKTYLIIITSMCISTFCDIYLVFVYGCEFIFVLIGNESNFNFDDFYINGILFFIKDLFPYLIIVVSTLIYRYK